MALFADIIINHKSPALDRIFTYSVPELLAGDIQTGMLVKVPFKQTMLEGVVIALHQQAQSFEVKDIAEIIGKQPLFSAELLEVANWVAEYYHCSRAQALQAMLPSGMNLAAKPPKTAYYDVYRLSDNYQLVRSSDKRKQLIVLLAEQGEAENSFLHQHGFEQSFLRDAAKSGLVVKEQRRVLADIYPTEPTGLNAEQTAVYAEICAEREGANRPFLLHGVTGSGKTEIYLRLIEDAAKRGQQSILLVPEIALSTQMIEMMTRRLELPMALLHSGLLASERRRIWQDIAEKRIWLAIGARSAVFAPTPDLGLIIIDEEHENSYKQENHPRFHAIEVAKKRCELSQAQLVLGSATPAVESYYQAQTGHYALGEVQKQYYPAPQTEVSIVDMREELRQGHKLIFSRELIQALQEQLAAKEQSLLFLNRRGYYNFFSCRDCGSPIRCPHCAVALSFHDDRRGGMLKCHYCGYMTRPPQICPGCGSEKIRHFGIGTQRVVDEVSKLFPEARVARLDSDVMAERDGHQRIYQAMMRQEIDILVGTQMVAKGLDFPHLQLAAVIAADTMLNLPDWRAGERTFQLISQLIGRAGRRNTQGRAIIQTYTPDAQPIIAAANHDYQGFYQQEMLQRQMHGYPPCNHLLRILLTSSDQERLVETATAYAYYLQEMLLSTDELCGPAEAPYAKIKDRYRHQLMIKTSDIERVATAGESAWQKLTAAERLPKDILFSMDIDPMSMF